MGVFKRNQPTPDPRDTVGNNPTGRPRRSSSKSRRQAANRLERFTGQFDYDPKRSRRSGGTGR